MGLIYTKNIGDTSIVRDYSPNDTEPIADAIVTTGKGISSGDMSSFSKGECVALLRKIDTLIPSEAESFISKIVGENFGALITLARLVKKQCGGMFSGELSSGIDQDVWLLEPKDVGGVLMNSAAAGALGLYAGGGGAVFTWYNAALAVNTAVFMIPAQAMTQYCGVIHLGMIEWLEVPKLTTYQYTMSGQAGPRQSLSWMREAFGNNQVSVARFELPIVIGPLKNSGLAVLPNIAGGTKAQLISFMIARAQDRMVL